MSFLNRIIKQTIYRIGFQSSGSKRDVLNNNKKKKNNRLFGFFFLYFTQNVLRIHN